MSLSRRTKGIFCVGLSLQRPLHAGEGVLAPKNARTSPPQGRFDLISLIPLPRTSRRRVRGPWTCSRLRWQGTPAQQAVCTMGTGIAAHRPVTRYKSTLTGQELGRWRRARSLYCLICAATLKRVRITVEGWAWASAVCCHVCVRKAWCRA